MRVLLLIPFVISRISVSAQPIQLHPENPHYFLFREQPTILLTSGEHYGAVLNPAFDYHVYLEALAQEGLNYTRIFAGSYFEPPGAFGIQHNTLAPDGTSVLTPWARSDVPGYPGGGNKFDLDQWNQAYFDRLRDFIQTAATHGIVVEVTLFSSIYSDAQWDILPFNPINNINNVAHVDRRKINTLENGNILEYQIEMVRAIVRSLNMYDNVFFEIQNEPLADASDVLGPINQYVSVNTWRNRLEYPTAASRAWQHAMVDVITEEESTLANRHMIALNYASFHYPLFDVHPDASILNFHHATPGAVLFNYGWDRVIGYDETGAVGSADSTYRRLAWNFMLSGGGLFNNLDFSFTVEHPDGAETVRAPGSGSPALRYQLGVLKRFLEGFNFIQMRSNRDVVVRAPGTFREVLANPGKEYAIYLENPLRGDLVIDLPANSYLIDWIDVITGGFLKQDRIDHGGGRLSLEAPAYSQDITLRIVSMDR